MKAPSLHVQTSYKGNIALVLTAVILSKNIFSEGKSPPPPQGGLCSLDP